MGSKLLALLLLLIPGIAYGQTPIHLLMSQSEARAAGSTVDPDPNLKGCWDMEETSGTRADATANGHDLTSASAPSSRTGHVGSNAADFDDASSQYLSWADEADNTSSTTDFSVAFWIWWDDTAATTSAVSKTNGTSQREWVVWHGGDTNLDATAYDITTQSGNTVTKTSGISTGQWQFVVYVWDYDTTSHMLSIDGASLGSLQSTTWTDLKDTASPFAVGARYNGSAYEWYLDGAIDAMRYYNGYQLTDTDITNLYNSGSGRDCTYAMP